MVRGVDVTPRALIDRNGRLHTVAVLDHWTPRMLKILGIREATQDELKQAPAVTDDFASDSGQPKRREVAA